MFSYDRRTNTINCLLYFREMNKSDEGMPFISASAPPAPSDHHATNFELVEYTHATPVPTSSSTSVPVVHLHRAPTVVPFRIVHQKRIRKYYPSTFVFIVSAMIAAVNMAYIYIELKHNSSAFILKDYNVSQFQCDSEDILCPVISNILGTFIYVKVTLFGFFKGYVAFWNTVFAFLGLLSGKHLPKNE